MRKSHSMNGILKLKHVVCVCAQERMNPKSNHYYFLLIYKKKRKNEYRNSVGKGKNEKMSVKVRRKNAFQCLYEAIRHDTDTK